mmetsp:Transcript_91409/g.144452  ORF Transcript_91409/g.144452 Transcript_91409/m.144452 type:complete len:118 (+) Transcript_91409:338-691(+)
MLVLLCFLEHPFDFSLCQSSLLVFDLNAALQIIFLIFGTHGQDALRVDVECHLDLRNPSQYLWKAFHCEFPEIVRILDQSSFAFENFDFNFFLIIFCSCEVLALLCRYCAVPHYDPL